jgi:mRNA interferase RelE/StbE
MPEVELSDAFDGEFQRKPPDQQGAILKTLKLLGDNPRHPSLRSRKIGTIPGVFYARVTQGDRLSYEWDGPRLRLRHNCHHDEVIRNP